MVLVSVCGGGSARQKLDVLLRQRPQQLVDGEGRNSSTPPLFSPAKKKHQTAGEVLDLHAGKLVSISSNGLGHQLCALEYQEASQKCLLQGCQLWFWSLFKQRSMMKIDFVMMVLLRRDACSELMDHARRNEEDSVAQMWSEWGVMMGWCSYSILGHWHTTRLLPFLDKMNIWKSVIFYSVTIMMIRL